MTKIDLSQYGITSNTEIIYNPDYDTLFAEETKPGLQGYEVGRVTNLGAVNVMTGVYTGRSPKDKFFVKNDQDGNQIDSWVHEIWKRVEMPSKMPENLVR